LKEYVEAAPGKLRSLLKKFLDELFLKRLIPFIKYNSEKEAEKVKKRDDKATKRTWPESEKDKAIKVVLVERRKKEEEKRKLEEEEKQKQAEIAAKEAAEKLVEEENKSPEEAKQPNEDEHKRKS